jgi:2-polyprenyl-6-methoxyphenol hydroxylase-like FAD-dependent oxidoreductase
MNILMIGGGVCGLAATLLLARDGHHVTVLERDDDAPPDAAPAAWESWERSGVAQFRQPHNLMPGLRRVLEAEMADIQEALVREGAVKYDLSDPLPPSLTDRTPRPFDAELWTYTGRRPVVERVFAEAANREPQVTVKRGVRVAQLLGGTRASAFKNTPHVIGVRTADGQELRADLVVDASGRQSRSPTWLEAIGARPPFEEGADSGFAYYTRYFRGTLPERRAGGLTPIGSISVLTLPGDNGTWSVTVFSAAGDQPLKQLRHSEQWTNTVRACPLHAHWLDGEPITEVLAMAGIVDRYRRFVVDDAPVATGFAALADAWACTNPSAGRGLTVGVLHAVRLRDVLRDTADRPRDLIEQFDRRTEADIAPWYHAQRAVDRFRFAEMEAAREGRQPPPPSDELSQSIMSLFSVMTADAELFRSVLEYIATITPIQEIVCRPEVIERIRMARQAMESAPPMGPAFGPDRQQLLDLLK